jgi:hypothetical protein
MSRECLRRIQVIANLWCSFSCTDITDEDVVRADDLSTAVNTAKVVWGQINLTLIKMEPLLLN